MKVSRFEPHKGQPIAQEDDTESFLNEIRSQQASSSQTATLPEPSEALPEDSPEDDIKDGFIRLADFLKSKRQPEMPKRSKRDLAVRAYLNQYLESQHVIKRNG